MRQRRESSSWRCGRVPALRDDDASFDAAAHHELARRAAVESTVLLTNDGILPLEPTGRIAVIGAFAEAPRYQGGRQLARHAHLRGRAARRAPGADRGVGLAHLRARLRCADR
jgi:beta-glucosidase-like glycosyl hydrolase